MKNISFFKKITFVLLGLLTITQVALASANSIEINLGVEGCNSNGICEAGLGETSLNCAVDCAPPADSGGSASGSKLPDIYNIKVFPEFYSAKITWNTARSTISSVRWGTTVDMKDGTTRSILFARNHTIELSNLKPGTLYYFSIESYDVLGKSYVSPQSYFFTKFLTDTAFPLNPTNVRATPQKNAIEISWQNPNDPNFDFIRIMKYTDRFRGDPNTGILLYEGRELSYLDTNVVPGKKYYYSVFAKDTLGRFSSGVGVSASLYSETPAAPVVEPPKENITQLYPDNFFAHQYNQQVSLVVESSEVNIKSTENTIIDSNTEAKADDYLALYNQDGALVGQYLFSFNKDSGRYQSVLPPLRNAGVYKVEVVRYVNDQPKIIALGRLNVIPVVAAEPESPRLPPEVEISYFPFLIILAILVVFLAILWLFRRIKNQQI